MSGNARLRHVQREYERLRADQPHLTHEELWRQAEKAVPSNVGYSADHALSRGCGLFFLRVVLVILVLFGLLLAFGFGMMARYEAGL